MTARACIAVEFDGAGGKSIFVKATSETLENDANFIGDVTITRLITGVYVKPGDSIFDSGRFYLAHINTSRTHPDFQGRYIMMGPVRLSTCDSEVSIGDSGFISADIESSESWWDLYAPRYFSAFDRY